MSSTAGNGNDILVGGTNAAVAGLNGTYGDNFGNSSYTNNNGTLNFTGGGPNPVM